MWKYISRTGEDALGNQFFQKADTFSHGIACVGSDEGYFGIDHSGRQLWPHVFPEPFQFWEEGLAVVRVGRLYGYINASGTFAIPPKFHAASSFSEGLALVRLGRQSLYINRKGEVILSPDIATGNDFHCGLAAVRTAKGDFFLNQRGEFVFGPYDYVEDAFAHGVASVEIKGRQLFINTAGNILFEAKHEFVSPYACADGLIQFQSNGKWGCLDFAGNIVIPARFDEMDGVSNDVAVVSLGNQKGVIDRTGKILFMKPCEYLEMYFEGVAVCSMDGQGYGYCNREGEVVISPRFRSARRFAQGVAPVMV